MEASESSFSSLNSNQYDLTPPSPMKRQSPSTAKVQSPSARSISSTTQSTIGSASAGPSPARLPPPRSSPTRKKRHVAGSAGGFMIEPSNRNASAGTASPTRVPIARSAHTPRTRLSQSAHHAPREKPTTASKAPAALAQSAHSTTSRGNTRLNQNRKVPSRAASSSIFEAVRKLPARTFSSSTAPPGKPSKSNLKQEPPLASPKKPPRASSMHHSSPRKPPKDRSVGRHSSAVEMSARTRKKMMSTDDFIKEFDKIMDEFDDGTGDKPKELPFLTGWE